MKAATGYTCFYDDRPEHSSYGLVPSSWSEYGTGYGCQASTAADMAKYLRLLLNRGDTPDGRIISEESFGLMTQHVIWTGNDYYGYGLAMYPAEDRTLIGHGGGTAGFMSAILLDPEAGLGVVALSNLAAEPEAVFQINRFALSAVGAALRQEDLPPPPPTSDPSSIDNGDDYTGSYHHGDEILQITAGNGKVVLHYQGQSIVLERRSQDAFYVGHPDFALFLLEFKRDDGRVVEAFHGGRWYVNEGYSGPQQFDYPEEWNTCTGHYRSRSPNFSNFSIVLRKGSLVMLYPAGGVERLIPLGDNLFRIGEDERMPDTLSFDAFVEGQALLADYCGCTYYRAFTP